MKNITRAALLVLLAVALFLAGRAEGIRHAIEDSEIFTVTCYNPEAPEESVWNGFDQEVFIELDGQTYAHGMYQG